MNNTVIQVLKNGPLLVTGDVELKDAEGKKIDVKSEHCALCRCGQTKNKPFCDGAHKREGFTAS